MKQDVDNKTIDMWDEECSPPTTNKTKGTYTFHAEFKDKQHIEFKRLTYRQARTLNDLFDDKFDMAGDMQLSTYGWKLND
jgi:hypothetical protein